MTLLGCTQQCIVLDALQIVGVVVALHLLELVLARGACSRPVHELFYQKWCSVLILEVVFLMLV